MDSSVSVSIISCSHRSTSNLPSLLPLVSGPPSLLSSIRTTSNEEGHSDGFGIGSLSIVGTGLKIDSADLVVGTGPLFDFGISNENGLLFADKHDEHTLAVEISSFVLICDSASDWGFRSSLLSNSSFSSCFTNEAPAPVGRPTQDSSKTIQEHTDSTRLVRDDLSESFADLEVWVISCTFSGLASEFYGSAILIDTFDTAVVITDSSFENCHSTGFFSDGGAITLRRNTPPAAGSKFSLTLFHCDFSNNTAGSTGGHLFVQNYSPVTVAQCTFKDSRSSTDTPLNQMNSIHFIFDDDCRFDNTTISSNEGSRVGGICFDQGLETGKIVLTDVLFKDNECSSSYLRSLLTDCMFQNDIGVANNRFFDCFSTSALPRCGTNFADTLFPDFIGPTIKSVSQTKQKNEKGDGYEVALSFVGVFTGTNRKYDVTLEAADGTRLVAKKVSFNKTVGTATFTLGNPSVPGITPFSSYKIVSVEKSVIESTSNEFDVGEGEEPDWKWWHHTSESRADSMVGLSFTTLQGPTLTDINAGLNPSNVDEAIVVLSIFDALVGSFTLFVYDVLDPLKQEISIGPFSISSTSTTSSHIVPLHPSGILLYEKTYIVASISSSTTTVTHGYRYFSVPARPPLTKAAFLFATSSHTSFNIRIEGADLPQDKVYEVTLDGFDTPIEVTFTTTTFGLSEELALGWTDSLNFDTAYPLVSLIHKETTHSLPCSHLTLQTDPRPDPLELFANDSVHSDPKFCGAKERPCSSLDVAWLIVEAYSAQTVSLVVIKEASLSSPISIGVAQDVIVKQHLLTPTLVIPSTASLGDSTGFISVSGTLEMREVNIDIQAEALSFVLFDVEEGKLVLKDVQISGVLSSSDLLDGIAGLCAWETGLIKLHNAKMETHSCEFSSIEMGEIWMESSNLSLISTQILSNGARFSSFPSAQQDVMCKSGTISILPSASDTTEDHWISSSSECSVTLNGSELKWPHFVASLDATNCTSTQSKKKDSFSVSIVGTKLIPCDLKLEVSESSSSSQSSKLNSLPVEIPLSYSSVDLWNETHLKLSIASSSLSSLSSNQKWSACIVYGHNEHTDSFVILPSLKERRGQALKNSLPWLVPVIVGSVLLLLALLVIVVVVICRRMRKSSKSESSELLGPHELEQEHVVKEDYDHSSMIWFRTEFRRVRYISDMNET